MDVSNEIAIRNFGWACYNRLDSFVKAVYREAAHTAYINEKINMAARDPMAWYLDLDLSRRARAVEIANSYYKGEK